MSSSKSRIDKLSYDELLVLFKAELKDQEVYKKDMILKLAEKLEKDSKMIVADINAKLCEDLRGFNISKQYIGRLMDDKYKNKNKIHRDRDIEKEVNEQMEQVTNTNTNANNKQKIALAPDATNQGRKSIFEEMEEDAKKSGISEEPETEYVRDLSTGYGVNWKNAYENVSRELDKVKTELQEIKQKQKLTPANFKESEEYFKMKRRIEDLSEPIFANETLHLGGYDKPIKIQAECRPDDRTIEISWDRVWLAKLQEEQMKKERKENKENNK
jgi:hypothetical protein